MEIEWLGHTNSLMLGQRAFIPSAANHTLGNDLSATADDFSSMFYVPSLIKRPCCSESIVYTSWGFHI